VKMVQKHDSGVFSVLSVGNVQGETIFLLGFGL